MMTFNTRDLAPSMLRSLADVIQMAELATPDPSFASGPSTTASCGLRPFCAEVSDMKAPAISMTEKNEQ